MSMRTRPKKSAINARVASAFARFWRKKVPLPVLLLATILSFWSVFSRTLKWLSAAFGEVFSCFGDEEWLAGLGRFLLPFLLVISIFYLGRVFYKVLPSDTKSQLRACLATLMATLAIVACLTGYPLVKEGIAINSVDKALSITTIVVIDRSVYRPEGQRWNGIVITPDREFDVSRFSPTWPASLLGNGKIAVYYSDPQEIQKIVAPLKERHFFQLSQRVDLRPSNDHTALYVALYQHDKVWRAFRRVSDPDFDVLNEAAKATLAAAQNNTTPLNESTPTDPSALYGFR